ncbi:Mur ligase family protein [Holospora curviuscula]|uniref:UDP-N-acetylmuramoyl-L-alanyl-D-glutamate--LD-lysine ligase n=1 Tax=Holospora curviuscula TaxID=1082868 RepID=A0A2S5R6N9_9PROT|nr:UDP-N-acetylmuramoyl-L-alanyl-D-glutamate--2,6-diaminopimelate ligase [Holospora curviuscula]PPE02999.1 UDP-N-acetylmuramoyl-L-alanyl-D-glutamate--LD-lysine ligase [Holospora curviuscula]
MTLRKISLETISQVLKVDLGKIQGEFSHVSMHSHRGGPDVLFWAVPSIRYTVEEIAQLAWRTGTIVVLAWGPEYRCFHHSEHSSKVCIVQNFPKNTLEILGRLFYPQRPLLKCAVTGTNGKTSTVSFLSQLWHSSGVRWVSMGTLGMQGVPVVDFPVSTINTADYLTFCCALHKSSEQDVQYFACEASSHGLHQGRIPEDAVDVGIWTSFSRDHLDYHTTMKNYWEAKASLGALSRTAWLVHTEVYQKSFSMNPQGISGNPLQYGVGNATDLWAEYDIQAQNNTHTQVSIRIDSYSWNGAVPWIGAFQCGNFTAALGAFYLLGGNLDDAFQALASGDVQVPPGRLEWVGNTSLGGRIYIDYAHTPDALSHVLQVLRTLNPVRLGVVFGCGGERDRAKRKSMGAIAQRYADWVIITDDNPRTEDPEKILDAIQQGCPRAQRIRCRSSAIKAGIFKLRQGHILLVAGKGHETVQWIGDQAIPFQDREVIAPYVELSTANAG